MSEQEPNIIKETPLPFEQERGKERFNWRKLPVYVLFAPFILGAIGGTLPAYAMSEMVRFALRLPKEHPANKYFDMFTAGGGVLGATVGVATEVVLMAKGLLYLFTHF